MMKNKTLHLTLKKEWFDLIKSGEKKEEYRLITPYWSKRFCEFNKDEKVYELLENHFENVIFTLGYPSKDECEKRINVKVNKIIIGQGKEEWGAEPGVNYFIIKLGDIIE